MYFPSTGRAGWEELPRAATTLLQHTRTPLRLHYKNDQKETVESANFLLVWPNLDSVARSPSAHPVPLPDARGEGAGPGLDGTGTALPGRPSNGAAPQPPKLNVPRSKQTRAFNFSPFLAVPSSPGRRSCPLPPPPPRSLRAPRPAEATHGRGPAGSSPRLRPSGGGGGASARPPAGMMSAAAGCGTRRTFKSPPRPLAAGEGCERVCVFESVRARREGRTDGARTGETFPARSHSAAGIHPGAPPPGPPRGRSAGRPPQPGPVSAALPPLTPGMPAAGRSARSPGGPRLPSGLTLPEQGPLRTGAGGGRASSWEPPTARGDGATRYPGQGTDGSHPVLAG